MPPSSCCQTGLATNCVNSTYLTAPRTGVQLRSIAFDPAAVAVRDGADSADAVDVAVGVAPGVRVNVGVDVAVGVDVGAPDAGTVSFGKFDHGPNSWLLASIARTAYW